MKYNPSKTEPKWQKYWEKKKLYQAKDDSSKKKFYQLETFPYPSAAGLHVGHPKGYIAEDIHARYMRMNGREVLYTMGWDAFGLPTENYAIKVGKIPQEVAADNIKNFKRQVKMFGLSYDWEREINTSSPEYYKWTQWLFLQLFKEGLAYKAKAKVNWCPKDQTVLANEQVIDGHCDRCGAEVIQKEMEQWFFRITDYADRLLEDLQGLDWPSATVKRQEDWIGKSEGVELDFQIADSDKKVKVFTTRPDTLFGATYLVLAPEHPLLKELLEKVENKSDVEKYIEQTSRKTELMRQEEVKDKTGVELKGVVAVNPATTKEIPVWIADYVLGSYGTGAIMAVPAHDERDFEFATKFKLPIAEVISGGDLPFAGVGKLVNSGEFDGLTSEEAGGKITEKVGGKLVTRYKIRDWSVSRQRYWGVPIPVIECSKCGTVPVPEKDLPVVLPELKDYRPQGMPPLAGSEKFMKVKCPKCGGEAKRAPETLDTFVDSSWYYLRYTDPNNDKEFASAEKLQHWMPVDLYVIGAEHTVLHLLYSRFITKFLHDKKYLDFSEPFLKLRHMGLILGTDGLKMSKSKGNVVNPDDVVEQYGADTVRLYEMFMGPFEQGQPWDTKGMVGLSRFLNRVWSRANTDFDKDVSTLDPAFSRAIKKIGEDITEMKLNTAVSELMKLLNAMEECGITKKQFETFVTLLAPFAPHLAEEIWMEVLGHKESVHLESWPEYDEKLLKEDKVWIAVQVNGKVRDIITIDVDDTEDTVKTGALASENVKKHIGSAAVKKVIYVKGKILNIII